MSRSFSVSFGPMPASIRMLASGVRTNRQLVAIGMRLRGSGVFSFSHMTFGTTPKTEPPSMRQCPSLRQWSSKRPSLRGAAAITPPRGASRDSADGSRPRPPRPRKRRAREGAHPSMRDRARTGADNGIRRKWADETSSCSRDGPLKAGVDEVDDRLEGGAGTEDLDHAHLLQLPRVVLRDDATAEDRYVGCVALLEQFEDAGDEGHVLAAMEADADGFDVFLDGGLHHHLRSLPQSGVNHLDTRVAHRAPHHFHPPLVAVEANRGGENSGRHGRVTYRSTMTITASNARSRPIREKRRRII